MITVKTINIDVPYICSGCGETISTGGDLVTLEGTYFYERICADCSHRLSTLLYKIWKRKA